MEAKKSNSRGFHFCGIYSTKLTHFGVNEVTLCRVRSNKTPLHPVTKMAASTNRLTICVLKESELWLKIPQRKKKTFFFLILRKFKVIASEVFIEERACSSPTKTCYCIFSVCFPTTALKVGNRLCYNRPRY